uniref:Predicted protein n=1 Tax=Hordeum vulgare subsp. vulgare TaxID=112509 RepID=F2CZC2_HORVV|nr:predicted protein [Hordeum vulgare subsp. vulgare]
MLWYVGSASSVTMFPTRHTSCASGTPSALARRSRQASWKPSAPSAAASGSMSAGCHTSSAGLSSGSMLASAHGSSCASTSSLSGARIFGDKLLMEGGRRRGVYGDFIKSQDDMSIQSFGGTHRNKMCVCAFIRMSIYVCT